MTRPVASRRPWPLGFLGMLALVGAVELALDGRRMDLSTVWADDWHRTAAAAVAEAPGRDVLCFGDSLVKYGVLPRVVEARAGLRTYNLAVNAGPMPAEFFLLRRALGAGARPRAIVADFFALLLPDVPHASTRLYPELATAGDAIGLAWTAGDADLGAELLLGRAFPSVRCRHEVRAGVASLFGSRRGFAEPANRRARRTWREQLGAQPMPRPDGAPATNPGLVADLTPGRWAVDPINAAYFERFVALAGSAGVPVFWLMPPLGPEVEARRAARGSAAAYGRFAREALARHPHLVVLDARGAGYGPGAHVDPIHLHEHAAAVLSADVADALAHHLGGRSDARWVDLPADAGRSMGVARRHEEATRTARGSGGKHPE